MENQQNQASDLILRALNDVEDDMIQEAVPKKYMSEQIGENSRKNVDSSPVVSGKKPAKKNKVISFAKRNWKKIGSLAACFVLVVVGGSSALSKMNHKDSSFRGEESSTVGNSFVSDNYYLGFESKDFVTEEAMEYEYQNSINFPGNSPDSNIPSELAEEPAVPKEQKLIYTANMRMETLEFEKTIREIKKKIEDLGGFLEQDEISDSSNGWWYYENYEKTKGTLTENMTIRIPANKYNEFLDSATGLDGKVLSLSQNVENITRKYNDVATTIQSLKTQEERLLEMLKSAETVEDMIYVEARLSEVQNELSMHQNHLNEMDTDVAYSTIYLRVSEVVKYTNTPAPKSTFMERLEKVLINSGEGFLVFLEETLFFVIRILPEVILTVVILTVVIVIYKKRKKNRKEVKKAEEQE